VVGRIEFVKPVMAHAVKRSAAARVRRLGVMVKPVAPAGARGVGPNLAVSDRGTGITPR
jgi:hypothetical protein